MSEIVKVYMLAVIIIQRFLLIFLSIASINFITIRSVCVYIHCTLQLYSTYMHLCTVCVCVYMFVAVFI